MTPTSTLTPLNPPSSQIFGTYGQVQKIVVLPKNASSEQNHHRVQSLVQFADKEEADQVKASLQGQPVNLGDQASFFLDIQVCAFVSACVCRTPGTSSNTHTVFEGA